MDKTGQTISRRLKTLNLNHVGETYEPINHYYDLRKFIKNKLTPGTGAYSFEIVTNLWGASLGQYIAFTLFLLNLILAIIHWIQGWLAFILSLITDLDPLYRTPYTDYTNWDSPMQMFDKQFKDRFSVNVGLYASITVLILAAMHTSFALQAWYFYYTYQDPDVKFLNEEWTLWGNLGYIQRLRDGGTNWQRWFFFAIYYFSINIITFYVFGDMNFFFMFAVAGMSVLVIVVLFMNEILHNSNEPFTCFFSGVLDEVIANEHRKVPGQNTTFKAYLEENVYNSSINRSALLTLTEFHQRFEIRWFGLVIAFMLAAFIQMLQWIYFIAKIQSHKAEWLTYAILPIVVVGLVVLGLLIILHYRDQISPPPGKEWLRPDHPSEPKTQVELYQESLEESQEYSEFEQQMPPHLTFINAALHFPEIPRQLPEIAAPTFLVRKEGRYASNIKDAKIKRADLHRSRGRLGDRFIFDFAFLITWSIFATTFLWIIMGGTINQGKSNLF